MKPKPTRPGKGGGQDLYQGLFDAAAIGIAVEDMEGRPLFANPALCAMLGFSEEELRNKHCVEFSPPEDAAKDWALFQQLQQGSIDHYSLDKRFNRKDGSLIWGRLSISLMKDPTSPTQLVVAMVMDISEKKATEEELQYLASRLIQVQEEERRRIGRELHDDIGQRFSLLIAEMEDLNKSLAGSGLDCPLQLASELHRQADDLASDIQNLSRNLHSSNLEALGLQFALRNLCESISRQRHVAVTLQSGDLPEGSPSDLELCFYRVAQEALNNVVKHSHSANASVELTYADGVIALKVSDSGVGMDPSVPHRGIGLSTMRERLRMFAGELFVDSIPGKGTTVIARARLESSKAAGKG